LRALAAFLLPAGFVLILFVVYPILYTFARSAFDATGMEFVGAANYRRIVTQPRTLIALRNNAIWVIVAPIIVTSLGLILAVLTDKIRWATAIRVVVFIPVVVSGLAAGVTFRFVYAEDPRIGLANAVLRRAVHVFRPPGPYPGARPSMPEEFTQTEAGLRSVRTYSPGEIVLIGMVGIRPELIPHGAEQASVRNEERGQSIRGVVWNDFKKGGGQKGVIDPGQRGLPNMKIQALEGDKIVARAESARDGSFILEPLADGEYRLQLPAGNFREPYRGLAWLGPTLILASLIAAYIWIHTGFALVVIGAGLAGINRDYLDSARVEGASEWQVLTRVTIPLLRHVLMVVLVTTIISVLKIFDLVIVVAPESVQADATVLALEMWRASFGGARDFGLGSAVAVVLFVLIIPAMVFNVQRFRLGD
jgi:alpha-glucoside transport system permease protein